MLQLQSQTHSLMANVPQAPKIPSFGGVMEGEGKRTFLKWIGLGLLGKGERLSLGSCSLGELKPNFPTLSWEIPSQEPQFPIPVTHRPKSKIVFQNPGDCPSKQILFRH